MSDTNGLFNKKPSQTYKDLLHSSLTNSGLGTTQLNICDGAGNPIPIRASQTAMTFSCGNAEANIVSISSSTLSGCTLNQPTISYVSHASLPLISSSLGECDLFFPGSNGSSENCQERQVNSSVINYSADEVSNLSLDTFSQALEQFVLTADVPKGQVLFFTVLIDKGSYTISQNAFGNEQKMLFPGGTYPSNGNFGSGVIILKMFYIALGLDQRTSNVPEKGNYMCGIVEGNCMVSHFG